MYIIVNESPCTDTAICSPVLETMDEALCALADLRSETGNDRLHIYRLTRMCQYEGITMGFDTDLWAWFVDPEPELFQCKLRDTHDVDVLELISAAE